MKRLFLLITLFAATFSSCYGAPKSDETTRVMCYNVRNCKGLDLKLDYDRCAKVIERLKPEVVAIQELDSMTSRYPGRYVLGELATRLEMHDYYAPAIDYKGGKYGVGILSKEPAISVKQYPLPCRKEPRTIIIVEFEEFYFACTHLSLVAEDQLTSANIVREIFASLNKPVIIAGDFNATPASDTIKRFAEFCTILSNTSKSTYPANEPDRCIDYIMTNDSSIQSIKAAVVNEPVASDHRPLYVDVKF